MKKSRGTAMYTAEKTMISDCQFSWRNSNRFDGRAARTAAVGFSQKGSWDSKPIWPDLIWQLSKDEFKNRSLPSVDRLLHLQQQSSEQELSMILLQSHSRFLLQTLLNRVQQYVFDFVLSHFCVITSRFYSRLRIQRMLALCSTFHCLSASVLMF